MNCNFKGKEIVLPKGFSVKEEGRWYRLYHESSRKAIAGISSECTASDFEKKVSLHIENFQAFIRELEPALS
ncbi:MAG: hypothetical protein WC514_02265 [Candidatus Paceibacterota bacterium]